MPELTIAEWGVIVQLILAVFTLVGIITSIVISIKAIKEVHKDRQLRHIPNLAFEPGGFKMPLEFPAETLRNGDAALGKSKGPYANFPLGKVNVRMQWLESSKHGPCYGVLRNYGLGPALGAKVTWIAQEGNRHPLGSPI